jgi:hypothetical protein
LCGAVLDAAPASEHTGRAKFQIAVTVCERCGQGWQDGAGAKVAISPAAVERATCDAQHIGSIDGAAPERAHQDVPPSIARLVWRRDGGRCRVPGCRSARGLELHHLVHRADGGSHDASNLVLACSSCHQAHHAGALTITGTADHISVRRSAESRSNAIAGAHVDAPAHANASGIVGVHVDDSAQAHALGMAGAHVDGPTQLDVAVLRTQAKDALTKLGWKPVIAQAAVATALAALGVETTIERLIFEALRQCRQRMA